ncbi:MAG TPA: GNAT family protein [Baekduia sp.]|nr:GNAT family protein [Baekduia sp.]
MKIELPSDLSGDGFVLRPLTVGDAASYAAAFTDDPELGRLLGIEQDPNEQSIRERASRYRDRAEEGKGVEFAIADPRTDEFLGSVILHSFDWQHRRCEVGFWLAPAARGRRLGADAVARTLSWAFDALDLLRVEMTTTPDNLAVSVLARRLGFTQEGVLRSRNVERGNRVDVVFFGVLREEWGRR